MSGKIFINYRRGDDPGNTGRLFDQLEDVFPRDRLFMDVDSIPPGRDFLHVLDEQVAQCDVLLAVIGKDWLDARDQHGVRRLDKPDDFVRIEIASALKQGKLVIPVLVHDARMPRPEELPEPIRPLARRNAVRLTHERFKSDADGLIKSIQHALGEASTSSGVPAELARKVRAEEERRRAVRRRVLRGVGGAVGLVAVVFGSGVSLLPGFPLWHLLYDSSIRTFTGHSKGVTSVAFSPDGRAALSGSWDKSLKLWELATGKELRTFTGHSDSVMRVAFAFDGTIALSGSTDRTLRLWEVATGKELRSYALLSHVIAFSPDGRTALSGSGSRTLTLWDIAAGRELRTLTGHSEQIISAAFAPDGRTALTGSQDKTLKLWDVTTGKELRTFTGHAHGVNSVAFSRDGRTALSGSFDKTLKLWDLATGRELRTFTGHPQSVNSVALAPDGRTALSGSWDTTLKLWEVATGKELRSLMGHSRDVSSIAFSPDGHTALSSSHDTTLKLWEVTRP